jgi:hypothetical protein
MEKLAKELDLGAFGLCYHAKNIKSKAKIKST